MAEDLREVGRLLENEKIMNQNLEYTFHKSVDDTTFLDLFMQSKLRYLEGHVSHLKALTY